MIQSPLNYTGGKFRLLPQILPLFPQNTDTFVDLFCGGCNVGINAECRKVIYNDLDEHLIGLYNTFKTLDKKRLLNGYIRSLKNTVCQTSAGTDMTITGAKAARDWEPITAKASCTFERTSTTGRAGTIITV